MIVPSHELQKQSVLLVRIADQNGLKAPITFDSLEDQRPPLRRVDVLSNDDVVRVSLGAGAGFIAEL